MSWPVSFKKRNFVGRGLSKIVMISDWMIPVPCNAASGPEGSGSPNLGPGETGQKLVPGNVRT